MRSGKALFGTIAQSAALAAKLFDMRDVMFLAGVALASYGAWCAYAPSGWMLAGSSFALVAVFGVRR